MRVLYNATSARVGGGLSYSRSQTVALAAEAYVDLTVLTAPWNHEVFSEVLLGSATVTEVRVPTVPARFGWEQTVLPMLARQHDVLISPGNFGSLLCTTPQVVILQNANYVGHGRKQEQNARLGRRAKIGLSHASMRRADLVVSVSDSLSAEIRREPRLSRIDLATIRSGMRPTELLDGDAAQPTGEGIVELVGPEPYLLSVANDYPHKRLEDLAKLPGLLAGRDPSVPTRIVFAGDIARDRRRELEGLAGPHRDSLVFLGAIADRSTMLGLYRNAALSISTSRLESFGLTLQEALAQGCPLVVSDIPAHREVAADQTRFFPVGDLDALGRATIEAVHAPRPEPFSEAWSWDDHARCLVSELRLLVQP